MATTRDTRLAVAVHILTLLAQQSEEDPLTSEYIAGSVNTNPVFIRRVLGLLSRAGLVASQPGVGGGWRLQRDAASISLLDVYEAVGAGPLLALHHRQPNPDCLIGRNIQRTLLHYFGEAEVAFKQMLARQTIAQVLERAREGELSPPA
ncbi:Rrf2 family transcriptional regulator [Thermogemmatispora carboxidivorans]|uniref:Rrf2 family transcriptional regulator n=1 Tax=Thermogemmatispora carboxidivorans TaxID=1382306 RepID=UPI00069C3A4A|nr:Rrf2 family transcriptional regulator [Thermogemmatispora carboxidivorans]